MAMEAHERELLNKTHSMVKEMYTMLVGTDDYKEGSVIHQMQLLKAEVQILREDKIKRDATVRIIGFMAGGFGSLVGGLLVLFFNAFIKR